MKANAVEVIPHRDKWGVEVGIIYSDCYNCVLCDEVATYIGLEKNHSKFCLECQNKINKLGYVDPKWKKKYFKFLEESS